jgi:hypothetical protein
MARTRIIYSAVTGKKMAEFVNGDLTWHSDEYCAPSENVAPLVMPDIAPYQSMIDGREITSRSVHRAHLRQHGCIEIGNETKYLTKPKPLESPKGLKETVIRAYNQVTGYKP